ncbi:putative serine/threonine protein kinase [Tripterygium wilfordii]|uniref:non-specific serine/threonine protein kinase n=1 Tax=Tripterygium wilfordii TaxID=458696 RepID=A0A7J7D8B1_TRIWF|nr:serine/threonine-protein kinase D6PKL2-like [Tripterygium wilfordii]KAF5742605.1 putative serine/threonine protein kinase [Tripterygium wilfordii]
MQPSITDPDDLTSMSPETNHSTSSCSEATTFTTPSYSSKLHHPPPCDLCWDKIQNPKSSTLTLADLQFVQRLGSGDIGSVYLVELKGGNGCLFAAKVMDNKELVSRNKENRARVEKEILEILDHPFLPTLYATLDSPRWSCLLTEFCPGGDLHVLRQRQPDKRFKEAAVRFYASEVVVALEYLHMMGIIYRDLKPENVLVRSDGHIMLTDFDLSLKDENSTSTALVVFDENPPPNSHSTDPPPSATSSCIMPHCMIPTVASCFHKKRRRKRRPGHRGAFEIVTEPIDVRSMSFVGTHEYLAPEVVLGDGHGNAVDWWTLGIFIFEILYGTTPFKGADHELTLTNIVARALEFPKEPSVPGSVKDLITQLLIKDPAIRLGSTMGATAIKHHPFFDGVNWALLRCISPPYVPSSGIISTVDIEDHSVEYY